MSRTPITKQSTFAGGEISPSMVGRTDLERYGQSVLTCRNWIVDPVGSLRNRPGTKLVREVKDSTKPPRLIPFIFNNDQAYVIEVGDRYLRFHTNGGVVERSMASGEHDGGTSLTVMEDSTATFTPSEFVGGRIVNNSDFRGPKGPSSGLILANDGTTVTSNPLAGGYTNGWSAPIYDDYEIFMVYELATPWLQADLARLKFAQQNDVMVIVHPDYAPQELRRYGDSTWTITPYSVVRPVHAPTSLDLTFPDDTSPFVWAVGSPSTGHDAVEWSWVVTSVDVQGRESLPSTAYSEPAATLYSDKPKPKLIWTAPTAGNSPNSYNIYRGRDGIYGYLGSSTGTQFQEEARAPDYSDAPPSETDPFVYNDDLLFNREAIFDGSGPPEIAYKVEANESFDDNYTYEVFINCPASYFNQGAEIFSGIEVEFESRPTGGGPWNSHGTQRFLGEYEGFVKVIKYNVTGLTPCVADHEFRVSQTWIYNYASFDPQRVVWQETEGPGDTPTYPQCVAYYDQRLMFGGFTKNLQRLQGSRIGDYYNFDKSKPLRDDDALDLTLASVKLDEIRNLVALDALITLTSGAEWVCQGVDSGTLTPLSFDLKPRTTYGCSHIMPVTIGPAVLYVADRGRKVREFRYDSASRGATSRDLSILVEHFFRLNSLVDWAWAEHPYQNLWSVRDDGKLLGMTYVPDQNVWAWSRHDTGPRLAYDDSLNRDSFESVATIPEGNETGVYVIAKRTINGSVERFVEKMASRHFVDDRDYVFVDSSISYDGRFDGLEHEITIENYVRGRHDQGTQATLEDSARAWVEDEFVGGTLTNLTSGASGVISANDGDTVTASMTGGVPDNDWDDGDHYKIERPTADWSAGTEMYVTIDPATDVGGSGWIGKQLSVRITDDDGGHEVRLDIIAMHGGLTNEFSVTAVTAVPTALQEVATDTWGLCEHTFSGLDHLEGEMVALLVDGSTHANIEVESGEITLGANVWAERLHVGIAIVADVATLPLEVPKDPGTVRASKKAVPVVHLELDNYRGLWVGHDFNNLREVMQRQVEDNYRTMPVASQLVTVRPASSWSRVVNLAARQIDPLPCSILSVLIGVKVGGNQ